MSVIKVMTDRNRRKQRKSVRHQGHDGQKPEENREKVSVIKAMTDRNHRN
ncbi:hypothetical protein SAMD00020551_4257 [Mesobacillus selenatarsenatis SF-1]|uniref:Uncharacterized protein n=1 Tax=Mesobacillus selenatarsenatis (strain DSM 18680 / JCM 14380 / FERM P-15431 / SF-1) TaxID=1321606 RepID=A0A0A8X9Y0_MESS1|nr:hypothetical protein SAMD00020551_4257 [Mesobacillus selenatarsenatis SF-1]